MTDAASTTSVDLLIVGAGPVGLFGAYYAGVRKLSTVVLDSLEEPGGQITAMYPEKAIFDVAGFPAIKGRDLVDQLRRAGRAVTTRPTCSASRPSAWSARRRHVRGHAPRLACASSAGRSSSPAASARSPRARCRSATSTSAAVSRTSFPTRRRTPGSDVVVVGGGDSALDWALMLEPIAKSVTLVHRRAQFRAHAALGRAGEGVVDARCSPTRRSARCAASPSVAEVDIDVKGEVRTLPCDKSRRRARVHREPRPAARVGHRDQEAADHRRHDAGAPRCPASTRPATSSSTTARSS